MGKEEEGEVGEEEEEEVGKEEVGEEEEEEVGEEEGELFTLLPSVRYSNGIYASTLSWFGCSAVDRVFMLKRGAVTLYM